MQIQVEWGFNTSGLDSSTAFGSFLKWHQIDDLIHVRRKFERLDAAAALSRRARAGFLILVATVVIRRWTTRRDIARFEGYAGSKRSWGLAVDQKRVWTELS